MKNMKRMAAVLLVVLCIAGMLTGCGGKKGSAASSGDMKYLGAGEFAISGVDKDHDYTYIALMIDGEDFGSVGGGETSGDKYLVLKSNADTAGPEEQENAHEVEFILYGCDSLDQAVEDMGEGVSCKFYVTVENDNAFEVAALIATNERTSPIEW